MKKTQLRRTAMKRKPRKENAEYLREAREWIGSMCCTVCLDDPEKIVVNLADTIHHMRGRIGSLLLDKRYWLPVCHECHRKIEDNRAWAIKRGYLLDRLTTQPQ